MNTSVFSHGAGSVIDVDMAMSSVNSSLHELANDGRGSGLSTPVSV